MIRLSPPREAAGVATSGRPDNPQSPTPADSHALDLAPGAQAVEHAPERLPLTPAAPTENLGFARNSVPARPAEVGGAKDGAAAASACGDAGSVRVRNDEIVGFVLSQLVNRAGLQKLLIGEFHGHALNAELNAQAVEGLGRAGSGAVFYRECGVSEHGALDDVLRRPGAASRIAFTVAMQDAPERDPGVELRLDGMMHLTDALTNAGAEVVPLHFTLAGRQDTQRFLEDKRLAVFSAGAGHLIERVDPETRTVVNWRGERHPVVAGYEDVSGGDLDACFDIFARAQNFATTGLIVHDELLDQLGRAAFLGSMLRRGWVAIEMPLKSCGADAGARDLKSMLFVAPKVMPALEAISAQLGTRVRLHTHG